MKNTSEKWLEEDENTNKWGKEKIQKRKLLRCIREKENKRSQTDNEMIGTEKIKWPIFP